MAQRAPSIGYPSNQRVHKKNVLIGFVGALVPRRSKSEIDLSDRSKFAFRHYVDITHKEELLGTGARYLILHKDLRKETFLKYKHPAPDITPLVDVFAEDFGAPIFEDEFLITFRIGRSPDRIDN